MTLRIVNLCLTLFAVCLIISGVILRRRARRMSICPLCRSRIPIGAQCDCETLWRCSNASCPLAHERYYDAPPFCNECGGPIMRPGQ